MGSINHALQTNAIAMMIEYILRVDFISSKNHGWLVSTFVDFHDFFQILSIESTHEYTK